MIVMICNDFLSVEVTTICVPEEEERTQILKIVMICYDFLFTNNDLKENLTNLKNHTNLRSVFP